MIILSKNKMEERFMDLQEAIDECSTIEEKLIDINKKLLKEIKILNTKINKLTKKK